MTQASTRWTGWHTASAVMLLALSALLQFAVVVKTRHDGVIHGDAIRYVFYAWNLKQHRTFSSVQSFGRGHEDAVVVPDKITLPGYPAFVSLFVDGVPDRALVRKVTLVQAALGVTSTLLAFLIALRLLPLGWAVCAGLLVAIQPHMAVANTHLVTEPLFTCLMLAAVLAMLSAARAGAGARHYAVAGLLLGLASLVRPQLQLLPLVAVAAVLLAAKLRGRLPHVLLATACFIAVLTPWYVRNSTVESGGGNPDLLVNTLYHGSFPGFMHRDDPRTYGYPYRHDPDQARITRDLSSVLSHIGHAFATEPMRYGRWYFVGKPVAFLSWGAVAGAGDIFLYQVASSPYLESPLFAALRLLSLALHWPLMLLAVLGILLAPWRPQWFDADNADPARRAATLVLACLLAYVIVLHAIGMPLPRYSIPFRPLLFVLGLATLRMFAIHIRRVRVRRNAMGMP